MSLESGRVARRRSFPGLIFLSPEERRLRAGWRLLVQFVLTAGLVIVGSIAVRLAYMTFVGRPPADDDPVSGYAVLSDAVVLAAITGSVYLCRRLLDRRSFATLGVGVSSWTASDLLVGIGIAGVQMALIYVLELALGWNRFVGFAWQEQPPTAVLSWVLRMFVGFVFVGWQEELFSRGYQLQNLAAGLNLGWGVALSSIVFALLHLGNPNASWVAVVGLIGAGLYLAYGYVRTRLLWLSIGLHIGWNFFEGPVFGFPVSGLEQRGLIHQTTAGPELWTGGLFGPEAGLVVVPSLLLGVALIYLYTRGRRRGFTRSAPVC